MVWTCLPHQCTEILILELLLTLLLLIMQLLNTWIIHLGMRNCIFRLYTTVQEKNQKYLHQGWTALFLGKNHFFCSKLIWNQIWQRAFYLLIRVLLATNVATLLPTLFWSFQRYGSLFIPGVSKKLRKVKKNNWKCCILWQVPEVLVRHKILVDLKINSKSQVYASKLLIKIILRCSFN